MLSLLFSKMLDTVEKRGVGDYRLTAFLLAILLVTLLWRIYTNYIKPYSEFPTYPLLRFVVYCTVMNKIPKHLPFASFYTQEFIRIGKLVQKEGIVLVWLPKPILAIFDKDAVKAFNNDSAVLDKASVIAAFEDICGTGLVTSNGIAWKTQRKLLNPAFHVGMLKKKLNIFNKSADILVKNLEKSMGESAIDVLELLKPCALGNICEYALGLKMNIPENQNIIKNYVELITYSTEYLGTRIIFPWLRYKFMLKFTPSGRKFLKSIEELKNFTRQLISAMRKNVSQKANRSIGDEMNEDEEARKSFAHILLDHHLKDNSFTMEDVQNQVITFMLGGFDTVSYALLWNLFLLGHNLEVQDEAYNEVKTLGDGNIEYEDLYKLKYLECVIKESMRLYPPIPAYGRITRKDIHYGKYNVPKGTDILFCPYMSHRDPEAYPDPEKFDPRRFMESNYFINAGNNFPFAEGIRYCIGKRFAMMEMKVTLAFILRNFHITSLVRREDVDLSWNLVLVPVRPLLFQFTPRI